MDGGNSPRRVVNRLFYFLRFRRPAPRTPQDNAKCNNSRQRARKARRARKRKTRNSTHVWSSNPESEEKRKIVDGDGKREKKVVTGPSVFICSTVAFSFTCIEFQQLTVRAFPFYFRQFLSRNLVAFAFENIHNTAFRFGSFLKTTTTHL